MHCPTCDEVTPHNSVESEGSRIIEWKCSKCGTNNGTGQ